MLRPACFKLVSAVALIVLASFTLLSGQTTPLKYAKSSEVKVKGVIEDVKIAPDKTVHIVLKSEKGALDVSLGPEKFLKDMEISFAKGDAIEVLGSQVTVDGAPMLLAREIVRNGDVMMMRDETGNPVWVGWPK